MFRSSTPSQTEVWCGAHYCGVAKGIVYSDTHTLYTETTHLEFINLNNACMYMYTNCSVSKDREMLLENDEKCM